MPTFDDIKKPIEQRRVFYTWVDWQRYEKRLVVTEFDEGSGFDVWNEPTIEEVQRIEFEGADQALADKCRKLENDIERLEGRIRGLEERKK